MENYEQWKGLLHMEAWKLVIERLMWKNVRFMSQDLEEFAIKEKKNIGVRELYKFK